MSKTNYTIVGTGHGGCAMAVDLTLKGLKFKMFSSSGKNLEILKNGLFYSGIFGKGKIKIDQVTNNVKKAIEGTDIFLFNIAAMGHEKYINMFLPHLNDNHILIFNTVYFTGA